MIWLLAKTELVFFLQLLLFIFRLRSEQWMIYQEPVHLGFLRSRWYTDHSREYFDFTPVFVTNVIEYAEWSQMKWVSNLSVFGHIKYS